MAACLQRYFSFYSLFCRFARLAKRQNEKLFKREVSERTRLRTYADPGFLTLCMSFFRPAGRKNDIHKEVKYLAAAGYNRFCVTPVLNRRQHRSKAEEDDQPFSPVRVTPVMNQRCASRKITSTGRIAIDTAAITTEALPLPI